MLPKKHRLSKNAEVNLTTAKGRSFFSKNFVIKYLATKETKLAQIGVIASNKVSKNAVDRNRVKRIIRQGVHEQIDHIKPGFYVVILKRSAVLEDSKNLKQELLDALKKSKAIL